MHVGGRHVDLNLLVVLEAIVSAGGVTAASQRLHLTQPAVSHALARLRTLFDDPLLVRQGHALMPTPLTRRLIEPLRQRLRGLTDLLDGAGRFDPSNAKVRFTLGIRDPLEILLLPPLMHSIAVAAPLVDLRTAQVRRRSTEAALAAGTLDLAVDVPLPLSDAVHRRKITANRLVVVARRQHPEVRAGLRRSTYLRQQHVMVTSRDRGPGLEDLALSERGLQRRIRLRCRNYLAAFRVVSLTDLVLTMPAHYADVLNVGFDNQILPLPIRTPPLDVYLYWHNSAANDAANRWLRDLVAESLGPAGSMALKGMRLT